MRTNGLNGKQYFMLLIDDYTRMTAVYFLKRKSETFINFKVLKEMVEDQMDSIIKCLISNNAGAFIEFYELHGIKRKFSAARTPRQNGFVERKNIIVLEMEKTMLKDSKLSNICWIQSIHTVIHILNKGMLRNNSEKIPYDFWKGRPANVKHFRVFGRK
jgi:transposase InsO family protein